MKIGSNPNTNPMPLRENETKMEAKKTAKFEKSLKKNSDDNSDLKSSRKQIRPFDLNRSGRKSAPSRAEIRSKVEQHNLDKEVKSDQILAKSPKFGMKDIEAPVSKEIPTERPSDVGLNDPNDPATRGKLKDLLGRGAISFNPRERDVLDRILAEE